VPRNNKKEEDRRCRVVWLDEIVQKHYFPLDKRLTTGVIFASE